MLYKLTQGLTGGMRYQRPKKVARKLPDGTRETKITEGYSDFSQGRFADEYAAELEPGELDGVGKALVQDAVGENNVF